jgi:hypothetical protein
MIKIRSTTLKAIALFGLTVASLSCNSNSLLDENVYSVVLESYCSPKNNQTTILQKESVALPEKNKTIKLADPSLNLEALEDIYKKNSQSILLPLNITCNKVKIQTDSEIRDAFNKSKDISPNIALQEWTGFYEKYQNSAGMIEISRPGYSKDGFYAVIYIQSSCGPVCGSQVFKQFKKINGKWIYDRVDIVGQS